MAVDSGEREVGADHFGDVACGEKPSRGDKRASGFNDVAVSVKTERAIAP